ncbi:RNA polymerase sigma-70 factor [Mucilaginibacter rubeus]|uniref:RNA polymerase sigma-70 factor n=1 Tax=Mucilaginibacter rubeus TaxID=2027860 RepID=A0AAE6JC79_9SPHI|nr:MULTISPECIES: RNA polymerase sigma-70 factor [Mucilaginibacter]QEM02731.1 RNA polymerase sigma-70 factor [Mucilaginibacter rubeus]QEM15350.1 RNA polymerase sigma-70 factor [Mucilaginibacter gossypii]QTE41921.1 RNA polymerase sigma-70 factor [Mucilaginibacter rubeus]QTE48524.1 RNA polymerase sigma-70 factor [Mucilaginibacter rubeus]QTE59910.1 RNA polymerase sigma-70 factor [Mucilaginibacter rubeus]
MNSLEVQLMTDEDLIALIRENDLGAFERIYNKYWSKLYLSAYNIIRDRQVAEDVTQEVLVNLWMKRANLKLTSLNAYLYTSVRYQVFNVIRSGKVRADLFNKLEELFSNNGGEELLSEKEINRLLEQGVAELPEKCRQIFIMSRKEHLSTKEIAERLGIAPKTVENQLTVALNRLRKTLGDFVCIATIMLCGRWF